MKKILFFDTETNGVPVDYKASYTDVNNWPRVIQLAWLLTTSTGEVLSEGNYLIKPDGWEMPTEQFWIDNGFSQEKSMAEGIPIVEALDAFYKDKMQADILVAHNLNFDHRIVWAEFIRAGKEPRSGIHKICTMMKSTNYCKIPAKRGYKWPKLEELYEFLFKDRFDNAHDAMADITATAECFFELVNRGVISLEIPEEKLS
ncbi:MULTISPECIES: 3'-5' exonuclease [unclassified Paraflavitalea]|uniref:3'-5' exonuclease n=1 Tax=unclassified Paraflavitalea TaxID=2798305 RepID=UPI003D34506F